MPYDREAFLTACKDIGEGAKSIHETSGLVGTCENALNIAAAMHSQMNGHFAPLPPAKATRKSTAKAAKPVKRKSAK